MKKFIRAFVSICAAMIGVQKKKNLIQDMEQVEKDGPWLFIFVGLIMTIAFVFTIIAVVQWVLP